MEATGLIDKDEAAKSDKDAARRAFAIAQDMIAEARWVIGNTPCIAFSFLTKCLAGGWAVSFD